MDLPFNSLNSSIAGLGLLVLLFWYGFIRKQAVSRNAQAAPEAEGAWPVIGHLPLLGRPQILHITLGAMADKYGPIFTVRLGIYPAVVVSTWEIAKEVFTSHDLAVSSRPKMIAVKHLGYDYAMFGFAPYGPYWREMRKIVTVELLSNRRVELLQQVRVSEAETSLKELYKHWTNGSNSSGHVLVEMKQWFTDLTFNMLLRMVARKRYFGAGAEGEEARRWQKAAREFFRLIVIFVMRDAVPFLGWMDFGGHEKAMKETAKELDSICTEWLEEHKRKRSASKDKVEQDFINVMLRVLEGTNLAGFDADTINKATCLTMIAGGSDTTKVTLTWALSLLLNNRHALKKVQEELDVHVGRGRHINEVDDISKLAYLQAVVKETLRLYPPGPLSGPRQFTEDCTVGGHHVAKGTRLIVNLWKIQTDPRVWPDPLEFRPERFLTTHKNVDVRGQHFELIPFGSGRRSCPGTSFGLQMVHWSLASFLHAFDVSTPSDAPVDMTESGGLLNMKATPLEVLVSPRLSSNLYE